MQRVEQAIQAPGCCFLCGRLDGPLVDTQRDEQRGRVYVCRGCAGTLATLTGADTKLREARTQAERATEAMATELAEEREHLNTLRKAVVLTLQQGAATKAGVIVLRKRSR